MEMDDVKNKMTFSSLIRSIRHIHEEFSSQASRAVNSSLTLRNWLIGFYILEYEQSGTDRASYGEKLLEHLSLSLAKAGLKRMDARELRRYRQFYLVYPGIRDTLPPEFGRFAFNEWFLMDLTELFKSIFALKGLHIPAQGQRSATLG